MINNIKLYNYETKNNKYYLGRVSKTTYDQEQENKEHKRIMLIQKGSALLFIAFMFAFYKLAESIIGGEATIILILGLCIGIPLLLTKVRVFN